MKSFILLVAWIFAFLASTDVASAAINSTVVWRVWSGGSNNNGGGWDTAGSGTDWSQQTTVKYAITAVTSSGAGNTLNYSGASADMAGNVANVISGTGLTTGFFEIASVVVGTSITFNTNGVSASICTAPIASGACVINIGGALSTLNSLGSATLGAVAGNVVGVKGSFTLTTTDTFAASGTSTLPIKIVGYTTTIGDGYLGRTNSNGSLITTNMPTLAYNSTFHLSGTGTFLIWDSLNISGNISGTLFSAAGNSTVKSCKVTNASTNTLASGISVSYVCIDSDAYLTGATGGATGYCISGSLSEILIGNRMSSGTTSAPGILLSTSGRNVSCFNNTIYSCGSAGIAVTAATAELQAIGNTIVGCAGDGINIITGNSVLQHVIGNIITDNGGYGLNGVSSANAVFEAYNRYRNNTSGNINSAAGWISASGYGDVVGTGAASIDYLSPGSNDYRLQATSPALGVNIPAFSSMGALQVLPSGGGGSGGGINGSAILGLP